MIRSLTETSIPLQGQLYEQYLCSQQPLKILLDDAVRPPDHILQIGHLGHLSIQSAMPQLLEGGPPALKYGSQGGDGQALGLELGRHAERHPLHVYQMIGQQVMDIVQVARLGAGQQRAQFSARISSSE